MSRRLRAALIAALAGCAAALALAAPAYAVQAKCQGSAVTVDVVASDPQITIQALAGAPPVVRVTGLADIPCDPLHQIVLNGDAGRNVVRYDGTHFLVLFTGDLGGGNDDFASLSLPVFSLSGGAGDDVMTGSSGNDALNGDGGMDTINGAGGDDILRGGGDADEIDGQGGADTVNGQAGDDVVRGGADNDAVDGDAGEDQLYGGGGTDTLNGGDSNDILRGEDDGDALTGDGGDDVLIGGASLDTINGGAGANDVISYEERQGPMSLALFQGLVFLPDGETPANVEIYRGTQGDDAMQNFSGQHARFEGAGGADTLGGAFGTVDLDGGADDDTLRPSAGATRIIGGAGSDLLDLSGVQSAVTVDMPGGLATIGAPNIPLSGVENVAGTGFNDTLLGDELDNVLSGNGGDDHLRPGAGKDTSHGGANTDTLSYEDRAEGVVIVAGTIAGIETSDGDDESGIEIYRGTNAVDAIYGDGLEDRLEGLDGNDRLEGRGGADKLIGGAGIDTASYGERTAAQPLSAILSGNGTGASDDGDTFESIEGLRGGAAADTLTGSDGPNNLEGAGGNDTLDGRGGADTISGNDGDDTLRGGDGIDDINGDAGNDTITGDDGVSDDVDVLDGDAGSDTVDYSAEPASRPLVLDLGAADGGGGAHEPINGFENVIGGEGDDTITGNGDANALFGGDGRDRLFGLDGDDRLEGDDDEDTLRGAGGADTIRGGDGDDPELDGGDGDDVLDGGDSGDTLHGGPGADVLAGGLRTDTVTYAGDAGPVTVTLDGIANDGANGGGEGDNVLSSEKVVGTGAGDTLTGDQGANTLTGGEGDDTLDGGLDEDVLEGGNGNDTVSYAGRPAHDGVRVSLDGVVNDGGRNDVDTLSGFENAIGGLGEDLLTGNDEGNRLTGGAGADTIAGGGGDDELRGDAGDDALVGSTGADKLFGGDGDDTLDGGADKDEFAADDGNDYVNAFDALAEEKVSCGDGTDDRADHDAGDLFALDDCERRTIPDASKLPPELAASSARDRDGDGITANGGDCNDLDPNIKPDAADTPGNAIDENCDGADAALPQLSTTLRSRFVRTKRGLRVRVFELRGVPAGAEIEVRCRSTRAPRCVFATRRRSLGAARSRLSLRGWFGDRPLSVGTVVEVRISAPAAIGRTLTLRVARSGSPRPALGCLPPGATRAVSC